MKGTRGLMMLLIALLAGAAAVAMASRWMQSQSQPGDRITVAAADIEIGARLSPEMMRLVDWPPSSVPPGAFADMAALNGRVVKTSVTRGEPLIEGKLAPAGSKGGLSAVVAEGKRAMTVRVNDVIGVAGFALPGNYVDIMVNTQDQGARRADQDHAISKIVLERILVLAVAQESDRDGTKPKVVNAVTLEVTPEEAEGLDLARSVGALSLVLRNQTDPNPGGTEGATKSTLLRDEREPPKAAPVAKPVVTARQRQVAPPRVAAVPVTPTASICVEVIRGTQRSNECF
jgi:pilus assembly protein CpaB